MYSKDMTFQDALSKINIEEHTTPETRSAIFDIWDEYGSDESFQLTLDTISRFISYPEQKQLLSKLTIEKMRDYKNWSDEDFKNYITLLMTT